MLSFARLALLTCFTSALLFRQVSAIVWDSDTCHDLVDRGDPSHALTVPGNRARAKTAGNLILKDVVNMAKAAKNYMEGKEDNLRSADPLKHWDSYRVASMYMLIFGATSDQQRWDNVRGKMRTMANIAPSDLEPGLPQPQVHVLCDDSQNWTWDDADGNWKFTKPTGQTVPVVGHINTCAASNSGAFLQKAYRIRIDDEDYIFLCTRQSPLNPLILGSDAYGEGTQISQAVTWSATMFHELMHVIFPDDMVGTNAWNAPRGERYGWGEHDGILTISDTYSVENPESYMFFALSLYLDQWFWAYGGADSFRGYYDFLSSTEWGAGEIRDYGLPKPPSGPWTGS